MVFMRWKYSVDNENRQIANFFGLLYGYYSFLGVQRVSRLKYSIECYAVLFAYYVCNAEKRKTYV